MATTDFKKAAKKASTQAHYLLEIDLKKTESGAYDARTIYLSDKYLIIEGVHYEGLVSSWGGMDVTLPANEGFASVNDFSISVVNKRMMFQDNASEIWFSDLFYNYYWAGCACRVYQWFEDLTLKSDALLIFSGITKQPSFNNTHVSFDIEEDNSNLIDIPVDIVTLNDYPNAPEESIGLPLPIVYGDDWDFNQIESNSASVSPCIEVDQNIQKYFIANHETALDNLGSNGFAVKIFLQEAGIYGTLYAPSITLTNEENRCFFQLNGSAYYFFYTKPKIKGSQYSSVDDYDNAVDNSDTTYITLSENETFYLKFAKFPTLGKLEQSDTINIELSIVLGSVTGSSPYGTIKYYNPGYDAGVGGFSTGANITAGSTTQTYDIDSDTSAKGERDDQGDKDDQWKLSDLAGYEYGITVNAGCTIQVKNLNLYVERIPLYSYQLFYNPYRPIKEPIKPITPMLPPKIYV